MVKRYSLILTFILFGIDLNAQYMAVCMKDGTRQTIPVSDIDSIVFIQDIDDSHDNYTELKLKERQAIIDYISHQEITVISESDFENRNHKTDVSRNEFVFFERTGVYMQIVHEGCGTALNDGDVRNSLVRFYEKNLIDTTNILTNFYPPYSVDKMIICRSGNTYTGSFTEGLMLASYGAAVPAGWLTFLPYIIIGRPTSTEEQIAKVRLIVPHTMGHQFAAESVTPYYYEITIQE